jgi:hypothetical protein
VLFNQGQHTFSPVLILLEIDCANLFKDAVISKIKPDSLIQTKKLEKITILELLQSGGLLVQFCQVAFCAFQIEFVGGITRLEFHSNLELGFGGGFELVTV